MSASVGADKAMKSNLCMGGPAEETGDGPGYWGLQCPVLSVHP